MNNVPDNRPLRMETLETRSLLAGGFLDGPSDHSATDARSSHRDKTVAVGKSEPHSDARQHRDSKLKPPRIHESQLEPPGTAEGESNSELLQIDVVNDSLLPGLAVPVVVERSLSLPFDRGLDDRLLAEVALADETLIEFESASSSQPADVETVSITVENTVSTSIEFPSSVPADATPGREDGEVAAESSTQEGDATLSTSSDVESAIAGLIDVDPIENLDLLAIDAAATESWKLSPESLSRTREVLESWPLRRHAMALGTSIERSVISAGLISVDPFGLSALNPPVNAEFIVRGLTSTVSVHRSLSAFGEEAAHFAEDAVRFANGTNQPADGATPALSRHVLDAVMATIGNAVVSEKQPIDSVRWPRIPRSASTAVAITACTMALLVRTRRRQLEAMRSAT